MPTYWRLTYSDRLRNCLRESLAPNPPDTPMLVVASVGSRRTGLAALGPHPTSPFLPFLFASKAPTSAVSFSQFGESMSSVERSWLDLTTGSRETSGPVRHGRGEQGRQAQQGQPRAAMSPGSKHPQHAAKVGSLPLMIRRRAAHRTVAGRSIQRITRWRGHQKVKRINTSSVARMRGVGKCAYFGSLCAL